MVKCECCVVVPGSSMHGTHVRVAEPATSQGSGITAEASDWLEVKYYCILIARRNLGSPNPLSKWDPQTWDSIVGPAQSVEVL